MIARAKSKDWVYLDSYAWAPAYENKEKNSRGTNDLMNPLERCKKKKKKKVAKKITVFVYRSLSAVVKIFHSISLSIQDKTALDEQGWPSKSRETKPKMLSACH